jgi:hypothetical protein
MTGRIEGDEGMVRQGRLATYERLLRDLYEAQMAVQEAENAMVAFEGDAGPYPGSAPLDDAMERREAAIRALVEIVEKEQA